MYSLIKLNDALKISKYFFKYCPKQNILFYEYTCAINVLRRTTIFVLVYFYTRILHALSYLNEVCAFLFLFFFVLCALCCQFLWIVHVLRTTFLCWHRNGHQNVMTRNRTTQKTNNKWETRRVDIPELVVSIKQD
jgi:hypothetical protein